MELYKNTVEAIAHALEQIFTTNNYADKVIERVLKQNAKWGARDRRFIAEGTYESVRWFRFLKEIGELDENDTDFYWKVFGTWCVTKNVGLPDWVEFDGIDVKKIRGNIEKANETRKIRESIPDWLDELGSKELGEIWDTEINALNKPTSVILRANTLKATRDQLQRQLAVLEIDTDTIDAIPSALVLKKRQNVFKLNEFKEGLFEVQDASSQVVGDFLKVEPGMRVIDACAGAGGKTLQLAALMKNKGRIISLDTEQWKLDELKKRARRAGASNIETKVIESSKTIKRLQNVADRLLLDVPCSGLGVLKRNPDAKWKLSQEFIDKVKGKQQEILGSYISMLKSGGIFVYATCSILPSENEKQVEKFITDQKGKFELLNENKILPSQGYDGFYMAAIKKLHI